MQKKEQLYEGKAKKGTLLMTRSFALLIIRTMPRRLTALKREPLRARGSSIIVLLII